MSDSKSDRKGNASELTQLIIKPAKKFAKMVPKVQIKDVANQLTQLVYGKPLDQCLGSKQTIRMKAVEGKKITIRLPSSDDESADILYYIQNIITHLRNHDVIVTLER